MTVVDLGIGNGEQSFGTLQTCFLFIHRLLGNRFAFIKPIDSRHFANLLGKIDFRLLFFRLLTAKRPDAVVNEPPPTTGLVTAIACGIRLSHDRRLQS